MRRQAHNPRGSGFASAGVLALAATLALPPALAATAATPSTAAAPAPTDPAFPEYIMRRIDDMYREDKSYGVMEMEVKTKHWNRTMSLESWSLGSDYSLIRILSPKKEKGTATLKARGDLFTYLSKTRRTIKISSGMMGGSWMGSHFTNDDLVQGNRLSEDYTIKLTHDGPNAAGVPVYTFTVTPKPTTAIVWGKIDVTVRKSDLNPVNQIFYDEDGKKVRIMEFSDYRDVHGKTRPMVMTLRPLDDSGEYTRITFKTLDFTVKLDPGFFTLLKLKSM